MFTAVVGIGAFVSGVFTASYLAKKAVVYAGSRGANVRTEYHGYMSAMIEENNTVALRRMLTRKDIVDPSLYNNELLWLAAYLGRREAVEALLTDSRVFNEYLDGAGYETGPWLTAGFMRGMYPTPHHRADAIAGLNGHDELSKLLSEHTPANA